MGYQLTSVICHIGDSVDGGHYNAAVRYNNEWYMYDDSLIPYQIELREVLSQQFTAYLFFVSMSRQSRVEALSCIVIQDLLLFLIMRATRRFGAGWPRFQYRS